VKTNVIEITAIRSATVLSVSTTNEDSESLERIFRESGWRRYKNPEWTLLSSATLTSALSLLREVPIPIILCDSDTSPATWREMLALISLLTDPPLLIVTSRQADERLWAEALNLGAYDVLSKPFDEAEVIRIVSLAWQHWLDRHDIHSSRTEQRRFATGA